MIQQIQDNAFRCTVCDCKLTFHSWRSLSIMAECVECHKIYCLDDLVDLAPVRTQIEPQRTVIVLPPEDYEE